MTDQKHNADAEMLKAFAAKEAEERVSNTKIGCALVVTLMPLGSTADYFVYRDHLSVFFVPRLICSGLAVAIWTLLFTKLGRRYCKWISGVVPLLPVVFLAWMIAVTDGFASSYYAALNLVLLAVGAVLHWTLVESIVAVFLVLVMYVAAGLWNGNYPGASVLYANFYFIALMDIIVVVGTYFQNRQRFREFSLRFKLDKQFKQLQETEMQLVQTEKLASLGRLSAGIMHEINNPLNYATTGLFTLRKKAAFVAPEQQAAYNETLADVEEGVKRVSAIVSDLRSFAHRDNESVEEVVAEEIISSALRFMSHELNEANVKVESNIPTGQKLVVNKNKLIQVCVNLLQNSLDALKGKPFIGGEQPTVTIAGRVENGMSLLVFGDNGTGIKPELLDKIYDPFFTTKDVGEGMGMGLSICHRVVQEYGGQIRVRSEPGKFCEFTLEFPVKG